MRDDYQRGRPIQNTPQGSVKILGIKSCKAFIQYDNVRTLKQGTGNIKTAPFPVGELPSALADHLLETGRHSLQKLPEAQFAAHCFSFFNVLGQGGPLPSHEQVERECLCKNMILMELGRGHNPLSPFIRADSLTVKALQQKQAGFRDSKSGQNCCQG